MPEGDVLSFDDALASVPLTSKRHVLLGNGFSRAWREDIFSYNALLQQATFADLSPFARQAFDALRTTDFEVVMQALRNAAALTELYTPENKDLRTSLLNDAIGLREVLAQAIASRHPDRPDAIIPDEYAHAKRFLASFGRIYTLNYDLLLYWALMQDAVEPAVPFDDGFRTPDDGPTDYVTWEVEKTDSQNVFYLHGALHIFDAGHEIQKYTWINTGIPLIDQVRDALERNLYPLFVSEGESPQKLSRIKHSDVLSRAYRSFAKIGGSLFIFGHAMSANDEHVIRLIEKNRCSQLFVSLYGDHESGSNLNIRARSMELASSRPTSRPLEVHFYDAGSASAWRE